MKILLVHKSFIINGGADLFFFEIGRVLKNNGHEVAYFSTNNDKNQTSDWSEYFVNAPDFKNKSILKRFIAFLEIPYNLRTKRVFRRVLKDFKPDIVHCFNIMTHISPSVIIAAHEQNIPVVLSLNDYKHICPNYKLYHHGKICEDCKGGKFYKCFNNRCSHDSNEFSFANAIESYVHLWKGIYDKYVSLFMISSDFMAENTEYFWNRKINKVKIVNPFLIPEISHNSTQEFGLYFGRLIEEKGVNVLLKALAICSPNVPFKIIGSGPDLEKLIIQAKDSGITNLEFCGPKWGSELNEYLVKAKYIVMPSLWHENMPYAILQAFGASKPVIGSRRGGIPELLAEGRGIIYEAEDYHELAERIGFLDKNKEKAIEIGKCGRMYLEKHFSEIDIYKSLINGYQIAIENKTKKK